MKQTRILFFTLFVLLLNVLACSKKKTDKIEATYKDAPKHTAINPKFPTEEDYFNQKLPSETQNKLYKQTKHLIDTLKIAGLSATVIIPHQGIWSIDTGYISKTKNILIDTNSVFYWASVSKLITATVIYQLIEENKLNLQNPLSNWFPEFENANIITIEHLLAHTNGIYSFNSDSTFHFSNQYYSPIELMNISKKYKNQFLPGEYWAYTNTGYLILALIAEKTDDKPFHEIIENRISNPKNLNSLRALKPNEIPNNLALAHKKGNIIEDNYSVPLGAGNMVGKSLDMAHFFQNWLTEKYISTANMENCLQELYPMFNQGSYYGKGIMIYDFNEINKVNNLWIGHSGGTENYKSILIYDQKTKIIMALSINQNISAEAFAMSLLESIK